LQLKLTESANRSSCQVSGNNIQMSKIEVRTDVSDAGVASVIDQNKKLESGVASSSGNYRVDFQLSFSLSHLYIFGTKDCNFGVVANCTASSVMTI
jgi:hypothetical protein